MQSSNINVAPQSGRHFLLSAHFLIPIAILTLITLLCQLFPLDLKIQSFYYRQGWFLADLPLAQLLYHYANIPVFLLVLGSLFVYFHSFSRSPQSLPYRKLSLYLILALVIGPGLIVNAILKDHWGRPRPRDVVEFGGRYAYEAPLEIDPASSGKSFPSGHATLGFYFYALAFVMGVKHKRYFYMLAAFATLYGALIGWVRIVQGGHFMSDVIWSGCLIYLSSYLLWKAMKLDSDPFYTHSAAKIQLRLWQKLLFICLALLFALIVSVGTPYHTSQNLGTVSPGDYQLRINLDTAFVQLSFGDSLYVGNEVNGFGFPSAKARLTRYSHGDTLSFVQKKKGYFTEFQANLQIVVDTLRCQNLHLELREGSVDLNLSTTFRDTIYVQSQQSLPSHPLLSEHGSSGKYLIITPKLELKHKK